MSNRGQRKVPEKGLSPEKGSELETLKVILLKVKIHGPILGSNSLDPRLGSN